VAWYACPTLVLVLIIPMISRLIESAIGEHDLAFHGTGCQKFDRLPRLSQREGGLNQAIFFAARSAKILGRSSRSCRGSFRYSLVMP
jgi:hypothetical protein